MHPTLTENELARQIAEVTDLCAPRRFAVYQVKRDANGDAVDFAVLGWGLEVADGQGEDYVELVGMPDARGSRTRGQFSTPESASRVLAHNEPTEVWWLDPEYDQG
ncbi:hypothetical protein [Actinokineospora inagensis]|uniref:hypothetical protein n=1 Tax=Actinokineospora inagensis TaxID=103730 RepID=UPI00040B5A91|nr:hypothetical protein [Actinokineospora inagensis]